MPGKIPQTFFSMTQNHLIPADAPSVPFGGSRMWNTQVTWADIETSQGVFNWTLLDQWIAQEQANGRDILYTFGKVPTWAGGVNSVGPPSDISTGDNFFKGFVTALVTRYKGVIAFYELWNEPNIGSTSPGTPAQLLVMAQDAYTIIKSIDPAALVVSPSGSGGTAIGNYMLQYFTAAQAAGPIPQDIFGYHAYLSDGSRNASGMTKILEDIKVKKGEFGIPSTQPTWFTEGSWGLAENYAPALTSDEQVAYLAQQYLFMANSNIERYYWYAWDTTTFGGADFGTLWDITNGIRPAGVAYGVLNSWLVGATITNQLVQDANGTWSMSLILQNSVPATIVWNSISPSPVSTGFGRYVSLDGTVTSIVGGSATASNKPILMTQVQALQKTTYVISTPTQNPDGSVTFSGTVGGVPVSVTQNTSSVNALLGLSTSDIQQAIIQLLNLKLSVVQPPPPVLPAPLASVAASITQ